MGSTQSAIVSADPIAAAGRVAGVPLDPAQLAQIEPALEALCIRLGRGALSEYAFANLYLFRAAHAYRWLPGPWPCVSGRTYDGTRHLLALFDLHEADSETLVALLQDHDCFYPVPQEDLAAFDPARFVWAAAAEDSDYLYPAANFRDYRGDKLGKKRNLMRQLLSVRQIETHRLDAARVPDAMHVLHDWMGDKGKAPGDADEQACIEALAHLDLFGFDGEIHYADGQPAGFVMGQRLAPEVAVMRFAKGGDAFKGIYQYMFHHFCVARQGWLQWLNFEQDLGLANFRRTKQSYQPQTLLAKYRVRLRTAN